MKRMLVQAQQSTGESEGRGQTPVSCMEWMGTRGHSRENARGETYKQAGSGEFTETIKK